MNEKELDYVISKFRGWAQDVPVDTKLVCAPAKSKIVNEPFGVALVMGSWNYPFLTVLQPLAYTIAAGNCAIIKPSELAPHCSAAIKKFIQNYLPEEAYAVLEGPGEVAASLASKRFDLIVFTGSPEKGKLVALAAAKNLVPCILELGGKSPLIVDECADVDFTAKKVLMGSFINSGQTCIAPDYLFVHEKVRTALSERIKFYIDQFFGHQPNLPSDDIGRVISETHARRIAAFLDSHGGTVIAGCKSSSEAMIAERWIPPTVVEGPSQDALLMKEEVFGPILPVQFFSKMDETIELIKRGEKPLAMYYFGNNNDHVERLVRETSSGAFV